ncbi:hypothetical protein [Pseudobdellovibrio exovorus]|uniref:Lipoprotein n=1 Tax=Pseudobdellovibrio exovorus JSS TaxID=1184267 RepID=M4V844_9BACT|nr:hypothetical protein [Pseudobdellovibrio exovorus]AGH94615.1 hypothetical protein A11Q_395 [Pseudobdellovibrio exovorus JSS]
MKHKLVTQAVLMLSLGFLTACPPNNRNDNNNSAVQQGRIMSQDANSFCDLNNGTLTCYGVNQMTGNRCSTLSKSYNPNDRINLCSQIYQLRSENSSMSFGNTGCVVDGAINSTIAQYCEGVTDQWGQNLPGSNNPMDPNNPQNPTNPMNPNQPGMDMGYVSLQCDFEAQRTSSRRWFNSNVSIPKTTALITMSSTSQQRVDLRRKFLGLDVGKFGNLSMTYKPARGQSTDAQIELRSEGMKVSDESVRIVKTGSASRGVQLEALAEGLYMKISCRNSNQAQPRQGGSAPINGRNLVCVGESKIIGTPREEIEFITPLNSIANGQEFQISQAVSAKLNGSDITYTAVLDRDFGPTLVTTSSLRSAAVLKANDRVARIDVTCTVQ